MPRHPIKKMGSKGDNAKLLSPQPRHHIPSPPSSVRTNLLQAFLDLSSTELQSWKAQDLRGNRPEAAWDQGTWVPEREVINPLVYDQAFQAASELEVFPWDLIAS